MSKEWIAFILFVAIFGGTMIAEVLWLTRKAWARTGQAVGYVLVSGLVGLVAVVLIGYVFAFLLLFWIYSLFGGPRFSSEPGIFMILLPGLIIPPMIFLFIKRTFLSLFKIRSDIAAWIFALVVTLFDFAVIPQVIFLYLS
ncbi:MAG: hypothetical protein ACKVRN_15820 [Pyrinomonadaceae bacterium]